MADNNFNLKNLKKEATTDNRFERRMATLVAEGHQTKRIETVVERAIQNLRAGQRSFVIYGEPQSGKTEMMIALTAKILDFGFQIVLVLLNDSVQLLSQNLERFQRSGISPAPKKFNEIIPKDIVIGNNQWVIFSKKNSKDLEKLNEKLRSIRKKVVIDDEADYATPNGKVNQQKKTKINELTEKLIGDEGVYIGVTATPARLDLNRTHNNQNESWIDMPPHDSYTGREVFFPSTPDLSNLPYRLTLLPDQGDLPEYLRRALFSFMVNVGFLNTQINQKEINYSLLVHTSGKKADHSVDYKEIIKTFEALREPTNPKHEKYFKEIWSIAKERFSGHEDSVAKYVVETQGRNNIVVMNSDTEKNAADHRTATSPSAPFTVVIGGNIISRGVTFNNLLSMFFTRDVKHKMQQDTYVQRARMFGARNTYLKYFELTIPNSLYLNWQQCFIFHNLSLESRRTIGSSPVWLEGEKIAATSSGSVDKAHVVVDRGEMSFEIFPYEEREILKVLEDTSTSNFQKLKKLSDKLGGDKLPRYLLDYIENFSPLGDSSIGIHPASTIENYGDADKDQIVRGKGTMGQSQLKAFPDAVHHIKIFFNAKKRARVFYKYQGNIRFLKTSARK